MSECIKIPWFSDGYTDVDGCRLGPVKVYECTVEIGVGQKLETGPKWRVGYEDRTPMLTDVRGCDQVPLLVAMFKDLRQDLRREPVDRNMGIPNRPDRTQNRREIPLDGVDLHLARQSVTGYRGIPKFRTLCGSKSNRFLEDELSRAGVGPQRATPSERGV